jgi:hypothetical protein
MLGSGSSIFANADAYEACLPFQTTLVALQPGQFRTRLTWMELPCDSAWKKDPLRGVIGVQTGPL